MLNIVRDYFKAKQKQEINVVIPPTKAIEYVVKPGDTLFGISLAFEANIWSIKQLNGISEDQNLTPGQLIKIAVQEETKQQTQEVDQNYGGTLFRSQLLEIMISIPIIFKTTSGEIQGTLQITYDTLTFSPDRNQLKKTLMKNLKKKENELTTTMLNEYEVFIKQREIYKCTYQANQLSVFIWGVSGVDVPIQFDGEVKLIQVTFLSQKQTVKALQNIKDLLVVTQDLKNCHPMETICYILYLIGHDHQTVIEDSMNTIVLPFIDYGIKNVKCVSYITFYDFVNLDSVRDLTLERPKEAVLPTLYPSKSNIITERLMRSLINEIPQYLQNKDWHLVYSPTTHGTSYEEFLRRSEFADSHIIFIKDQDGYDFGAFISESWKMSKNKFFGTGETFLFKVKNGEAVTFKSTQLNQCYQMADDTGFSIGAGDRYGLWVHNELCRGNSYPCETFANEVLSHQNEFKIRFLEVWCFKEDWKSTLLNQQVRKSLLNT